MQSYAQIPGIATSDNFLPFTKTWESEFYAWYFPNIMSYIAWPVRSPPLYINKHIEKP